MMTMTWSGLLYRASRALSSLDVAQQVVRDELLFAFLPASERNRLTFDAYAHSRPYVAGGEYFLAGLWAWEAALLEDSRVPRAGRVLLGAAGGGRELQALIARGYEVYAFEPVAQLCESARTMAHGSAASVVQASYEDLVARATRKPGPLDDLSGHVALCILGWGSLSHVTEPAAVVATLRAVRTLAPEAPVIASFTLRTQGEPDVKGGARKLRHVLRRALQAVGGSPVSPGLKFGTAHGFFYEFSRTEFVELCAQAGYEVACLNEMPHPHALLLPMAAAG